MTQRAAFTLAAVGLLVMFVGVVLLVPPWVLIVAGAALAVTALLVPVKERRGQSADEAPR